jgi:oligoendopeptidase F
MLSCVLGISVPATAQTGELKDRSQIAEKYKWDLTAMYKTDADWEKDVASLEAAVPSLKSFEGKISKSGADLLAYFKAEEEIGKRLDNAASYASMKSDEDTRDQKYSGYEERIASLGQKFGEALAWFSPELVSISDATFDKWYQELPALKLYKQYIDNNLRTRKHTLSQPEERILALSSNLARCPSAANSALREADMTFPSVKDEKGNDVELSEGRMSVFRESPDRNVRRNASLTFLETYGKYKNTAAALMNGNVAGNVFNAQSRHYQSALEASLDAEHIDTTVYLALIETVKKNSPVLQKYVELRRKALGLDTVHMYDMGVPLLAETRREVSYDDAVKTVEAAMTPLGKEYMDAMTAGFNSRWVDVYETKGKRSGGYSTATYLSHPYILLNQNNTLDDMFTVAHEMGHAMHFWHSAKYQPFVYSQYTYFVAEVASTFNEALLMDHLLKIEKDPKMKLRLLNQYISQIYGTVITQTMWADFELRMHRAMEAGQPLTAETLSDIYLANTKDYFGNSIALDPQYGYTWIRIPHFYRNFYVYRYATSFSASQILAQKVLANEKGAREKYIQFLSTGSSKYPIDMLKDAGVDMTGPAPVQATMKKFGELVDQMDKLLQDVKAKDKGAKH